MNSDAVQVAVDLATETCVNFVGNATVHARTAGDLVNGLSAEGLAAQGRAHAQSAVERLLESETLPIYVACMGAAYAVASLLPFVLGAYIREHLAGLQSLGMFVGYMAAAFACHPEYAHHAVNPLKLDVRWWFAGYAFKLASITLLDKLVERFGKLIQQGRLQYRVKNAQGRETDHELVWIDYLYLFLNSFLETIFLFHLVVYVWEDDILKWGWAEVTVWNTLPALWLCLFINDLLYAPTHWAMHLRFLYPYIHKHHHRSVLPSRYYWDAGNEHPLEQVGGLSCLWYTLHIVPALTGMHVGVMCCHFPLYLTMQILNHSPFDIRFNVLGIQYESGLHEMHHRIPKCNMAQYCMTLDKLTGWYRPYKSE